MDQTDQFVILDTRLRVLEQTLVEIFTLLREVASEVIWADKDDSYEDLEDSSTDEEIKMEEEKRHKKRPNLLKQSNFIK